MIWTICNLLLATHLTLPCALAAFATKSSLTDPCANGATNGCVEHSRCESNFYPTGQVFQYHCPCVEPYTEGNGFTKCQTLCQKQAEDAAAFNAANSYISPVCDKDTGLFSRAQCEPNGNGNWTCRCVNKETGTVIVGSTKPYDDFHFDDCVEPTRTGMRCDIAHQTVLDQSNSLFRLPICDQYGDYEIKQCDMKVKGECWCVDTIDGKEIERSRGSAFDESFNCDLDDPCDVPELSNGLYTGTIVDGKVAHKTLVHAICHIGFKMRGPIRRKCLNGLLNKRANRCIKLK